MTTKIVELYKWYGGTFHSPSKKDDDLVDYIKDESDIGNDIILDFVHVRYIGKDFFYKLFLSEKLHNDIKITFDNMDNDIYYILKPILDECISKKLITETHKTRVEFYPDNRDYPYRTKVIDLYQRYGDERLFSCEDNLPDIIKSEYNNNRVLLDFKDIKVATKDFFFDLLPFKEIILILDNLDDTMLSNLNDALSIIYNKDLDTRIVFKRKITVKILKTQ